MDVCFIRVWLEVGIYDVKIMLKVACQGHANYCVIFYNKRRNSFLTKFISYCNSFNLIPGKNYID